MLIGVPKEIKNNENRVALIPENVKAFLDKGHTIFVEKNAGVGSGFLDEDYVDAGAVILNTAREVYEKSQMIIKVKEPQPSEYEFLREDLVLFTYLHLANEPELTKVLLSKKVKSIAYETVQKDNGHLPLLTPMSEIAGKMAVQIGAKLLEKYNDNGAGILMGGVPGVAPAEVVIIGGGTVGTNAAKLALGMGANVTILNNELERLRYLADIFQGKVKTIISNIHNIEKYVASADLVIGAALVPGAKAPTLVTEDTVKKMKKNSVIVDVAIDQGGIFETIDKITTHENPTYVKHGVIHYAVANIPGAVPRTATLALTNATIPYALQIANLGFTNAVKSCEELLKGVATYKGKLVSQGVADALGLESKEISALIGF